MPEQLKAKIEGSVERRNRRRGRRFPGRTAEESAYAIMQSMGAMKGPNVTAKGRRIEKKLKE